MDMSNLGFDEALARLMQTKPDDLADAQARVAKRGREIRRNVRQQEDLIEAGGRIFSKPFRP